MSNKKPVPGYIWLLAGLVIGLFVSFLMYLDKQPTEDLSFTEAVKHELQKVREQAEQNPPQNTTPQSNDTADTDKPASKPRFEFYTILSELEVFVPEPEISNDNNNAQQQASTAARPTANNHKQYLLQAGSFKSKQDAERLKASLALLGVTSSIQSVQINQDHWHRVRIGPFSNPANLRDTLSTLKQNNIHAMTMELK